MYIIFFKNNYFFKKRKKYLRVKVLDKLLIKKDFCLSQP